MSIIQVHDLDFESVREENYNISLFASGYESRCVHVPMMLEKTQIDNPLIFGFKEQSISGDRVKNDQYYLDKWNKKPILLSSDDDKLIYDYLHEFGHSPHESIHMIVDYSSMSRLWYAAVLNWTRFAESGKKIIIDFVYSMGRYDEEKQPMVIKSMVSMPGCEGRAYRLRESIAVFGLGFHGLAALCVLDHLEADTVYAFYASPGSSSEYVEKTLKINNALISNYNTKNVFKMPLSSLETCYRYLAEIIAPHRPDGEITLVPMGPKPHVLASILIAMRFPEVACLRVSGTPEPINVKATGEIVATRIIVHAKKQNLVNTDYFQEI